MGAGATSCGAGPNSGVVSLGVVGRVANAPGTCVSTSYTGPYANHGTLCTDKRLGKYGQCVSFGVSNVNAARSSEPAVGGVRVVNTSECERSGG